MTMRYVVYNIVSKYLYAESNRLNRFAITSADIGSAMERSAAALKAGGNDLNESIGLITAGNLIQQDADTTANAIKVLSLRIRGRIVPPYMVTYMLCS